MTFPLREKLRLRDSLLKGVTFGLSSASITSMGLLVGLATSTNSRSTVIGGLIVIALADSMSDSLAIHISEESEHQHDTRHVWASTLSTLLVKLIFVLTFILPVLILPLGAAVIVGSAWGLLALGLLSYAIAKAQKKTAWHVVMEHLGIAALVVTLSYAVGAWVETSFTT